MLMSAPPQLDNFSFVEFVIDREEKFGGRVTFTVYQDLEEAYKKDEVYPLDLKNGVANELNKVRTSGRGCGVMWLSCDTTIDAGAY